MSDRLILGGFEPFIGQHCETTALRRALDYHRLSLSEEMLLGLGGGIGFIYWYMKLMPAPFVGGRYGKGSDFSLNIARRIGAEMSIFETSSPQKGYAELKALLASGEPAIVYGDMAYLPHVAVPEVAHFGGHVFVVFGLDEEMDEIYIYDRGRDPVMASISDLARARGSKFPPFPPRHRLLKIRYPQIIGDLKEGITESIRECCHHMLNPPIKNIGLAGMRKWAQMVTKWPQQFKGLDLVGTLLNGFMYIEIAGTGGSAFRTMYARFLEEAGPILDKPALAEVAEMMRQSARLWSEIAASFLPDACPNLRKIRELCIEKNRLFEEQEPGALEAMLRINEQFSELLGKAAADLRTPPAFLAEVSKSILKLRQIEEKAFLKLDSIVAA
ncbi:MAG: BtrH N-terminal domain-containing protein [Chloroflexota bacterium]